MATYNLGFISDEDIREHVSQTVLHYRMGIDLKEFNKNLIDPVKMTFDSKIYRQTIRQTLETECLRQIDKSNTNNIGYFHQYLFKYAGDGWQVPANGKKGGFDVVNDERHIYVEMKNKHNTMNSSAASNTYLKMQSKILRDDKAVCMLVEAIATKSQDIVWALTIDQNGHKEHYSHERIRRVSMDKFYGIVFGDCNAFAKLCAALPRIIDDVLDSLPEAQFTNSVYEELGEDDFYRNLYLLAFKTYDGFDKFKIQ